MLLSGRVDRFRIIFSWSLKCFMYFCMRRFLYHYWFLNFEKLRKEVWESPAVSRLGDGGGQGPSEAAGPWVGQGCPLQAAQGV